MTRGVGLIPSAEHLSSNLSNISFTVSNNSYRVGIVGATGAVGQELIALLQARAFPLAELRPLASARSSGKSIDFGGKKITVQEATPEVFAGLNVCFFAAGGSVTAPETVLNALAKSMLEDEPIDLTEPSQIQFGSLNHSS